MRQWQFNSLKLIGRGGVFEEGREDGVRGVGECGELGDAGVMSSQPEPQYR